jgi:flagellar protein FlaG
MNIGGLTAIAAAERPGDTGRPSLPPPSPAAVAREAAPEPQAASARLEEVTSQLSRALADSRRELSFSVDEVSGRTVVKVIDAESGDVLRQIPTEEALRLASRLRAGEELRSLGLDGWS